MQPGWTNAEKLGECPGSSRQPGRAADQWPFLSSYCGRRFLSSSCRRRRSRAGHPLPEVRERALRSLQFKLQHGLLPAEALAADTTLLRGLLACLELGAGSGEAGAAAAALEVLAAVARDPGVAAALLELGTDQVALGLQDRLPAPAQGLLDELLAGLFLVRQRPEGLSAEDGRGPAHHTVPLGEGGGFREGLPPRAPGAVAPALPAPAEPKQPRWQPGSPSSPGAWAIAAAPGTVAGAATLSTHCAGASKCGSDAVINSSVGGSADSAALVRGGLCLRARPLSCEDRQQLDDLCGRLAHCESEAEASLALLQLQGALADVPAPSLLAGTDVVPALLAVTSRAAPGSRLAEAALCSLHRLVLGLRCAAAEAEAAQGGQEPAAPACSVPLAPAAHQMLLACSASLGDPRLHHVAVPLLADLASLARPARELAPAEAAAFCCGWRGAMAALADALRLAMVGAWTWTVPWDRSLKRAAACCMQHAAAGAALLLLQL